MARRGVFPAVAAMSVGLFVPTNALAYIDPAAGSILLQALLGGVAGILVIGKLYYRKLKALFGHGPKVTDKPADGERGAR
jgi:hypothetical protein